MYHVAGCICANTKIRDFSWWQLCRQWPQRRLSLRQPPVQPWRQSWHHGNFLTTSGAVSNDIVGIMFDNTYYRQWRQSWHHDNYRFSVDVWKSPSETGWLIPDRSLVINWKGMEWSIGNQSAWSCWWPDAQFDTGASVANMLILAAPFRS